MNENETATQILQALQSLKGDFGRLEQSNADMKSSLEEMRSSAQTTREKMIEHLVKYEAKAESMKSLEDSQKALHRRLDEMAIELRDNSNWISEKKEQQSKREDRIASGVYSIGFDWITKILIGLAVLSYIGWQWQLQQNAAPEYRQNSENADPK